MSDATDSPTPRSTRSDICTALAVLDQVFGATPHLARRPSPGPLRVGHRDRPSQPLDGRRAQHRDLRRSLRLIEVIAGDATAPPVPSPCWCVLVGSPADGRQEPVPSTSGSASAQQLLGPASTHHERSRIRDDRQSKDRDRLDPSLPGASRDACSVVCRSRWCDRRPPAAPVPPLRSLRAQRRSVRSSRNPNKSSATRSVRPARKWSAPTTISILEFAQSADLSAAEPGGLN